jgi:hypothetical protein
MNTDLWKLYIFYTNIWLGQKKINIIQCEKFFDHATLNQESTLLWCPHDILKKTILSNQGPLISWPSHIHNISILTILCGEQPERMLLQMFHLNFMKCTLTYFLRLCYVSSNYLPNSVQHLLQKLKVPQLVKKLPHLQRPTSCPHSEPE